MAERDTCKALMDSLVKLSKNRDIEQITVKEISAEAGVTPQTFYHYYRDKYELVLATFRCRVGAVVNDYIAGNISWEQALLEYFKSIRERGRAIHNAYRSTGQDDYRVYTTSYLVAQVEEMIAHKKGVEKLSEEDHFAITMYFGGVTYIIEAWLSYGMINQDEFMAKAMVKALPADLKEYF